MFPETAYRIRCHLNHLERVTVLNLGSSTQEFYTVQQPYIWTDVLEPLKQRHCVVVNVDAKSEPGVHVVRSVEKLELINIADVVLCCNLLEHVENPKLVIPQIDQAVRDNGLVVFDGPKDYPYHPDPIDNMFRPQTAEEWDALVPPTWVREHYEVVVRRANPKQTASLVIYRKHAVKLCVRLSNANHESGCDCYDCRPWTY